MDEENLIILVQGHECLCNLQHKDYDNILVKDNSWKEIFMHNIKNFHDGHNTVGKWQGCGGGTAWYV
jgi:hypothetical protein